MAEPGGPDDQKPQSDEARSAFSQPAGVGRSAGPSDEDHPTSEFSLPSGLTPEPQGPPAGQGTGSASGSDTIGSAFAPPSTYDARNSPPAFTPAHGIPMIRLTKEAPWQDRMRTMLRMPVADRPAPEPVQRHDDAGPAVPRVLDLTLRIGELLLAGGEGAEDVEAAMFAVTRSYGLDRCEPTVTFTLLSISHQPSLVEDPVTASRTVRRRGTDYTRLAAVFRLIDDITTVEGEVSLEEAYRRLAEIRRNRHPYPGWVLTMAAGGLAGAASVLVGGGPLVFLIAALGAMLGDRLAWLCAGRGLPEFYQFVVAAMPPAAMGVALTLTHWSDVRPSAVITGGLFALLPGRALVAGVQDGLTGYYITASARLLEVMYFFIAIVAGVLLALYGGLQLGAELDPEARLISHDRPVTQILASMVLTLAFAILLQQERSTVLAVTLNGGVAWVIYGAMARTGNLSAVAATAAAAGLVGLFGQLFSRYRYTSSLPFITAAIGPLLPGSATYFGLLGVAQNELDRGLASLSTAVATALAIAIGVNLGSEISRLFMRVPGAVGGANRRAAKRTRGF
ncbi:threonine/serine exporter family protein [Streptomyces poriferorum]|uniref:Threonine/serine exporter family protein n=1 Tax=Streptomyces poriferorum TaxID=2798799 RepID=A0ABY9IVL6_9ACTN|nr:MULTISPECIES: threonine/serine exporter family protein [Streptomyces]WSQ45529.1 threonine/serine exporter family protein [Streptomyces sp. NBC_01220]MBW5248226.1 threonine/serine exporter family protein [Streptomyces poriferorum]MBW5262734.1 threonine/serine exporter family protein [Streptomyces poriferorum]MDP5312898.1 threonine/serine exporter family protein [Streptomyces sp. Alt4]WLQ49234.1 threonine/serine exporter family protein [Streptomyces sp. Alt1]